MKQSATRVQTSVRKLNRERELPKLVGKEVLIKDKHVSGYGILSMSEEVAGYTGAVYFIRGRNLNGKFQVCDVSWVEGGTVWLW